jgi:hypothetical protein
MCKGRREEQGLASEGKTPHASFVRSNQREHEIKEGKATQHH